LTKHSETMVVLELPHLAAQAHQVAAVDTRQQAATVSPQQVAQAATV
jgi:hypothetical protein